jgi:adenylate kinase
LLGAPGVGKGTQAALLRERFGACHLSTGDIFRNPGKHVERSPSTAIKQALAYMRRGELVPDSIVLQMVRERKSCLHCCAGFILDGFPRTLAQAESLNDLLQDERLALTAVINYDLAAEEIMARLGGRRTCSQCKAVYHVSERPPKVADRCDLCHASLYQREDDRPQSIRVRLEAYRLSTAPLTDFYRKLDLLVSVDATGKAEEIYMRTVGQLNLRATRAIRQIWAAVENHRSGI